MGFDPDSYVEYPKWQLFVQFTFQNAILDQILISKQNRIFKASQSRENGLLPALLWTENGLQRSCSVCFGTIQNKILT